MSRPGQRALVGVLLLPSAVVLGPLAWRWISPDGRQAVLAVAVNQPGLILNTVAYGALTALAATLLGWGLAHLQHVYAPPGRALLHNLTLAPLLMPSFTFAMALILLFVEMMIATASRAVSILNHGLSMVVFIVCVLAFVLMPSCGNSVFFLLLLINLVDVVAGYSISIVTARRDIALGANE